MRAFKPLEGFKSREPLELRILNAALTGQKNLTDEITNFSCAVSGANIYSIQTTLDSLITTVLCVNSIQYSYRNLFLSYNDLRSFLQKKLAKNLNTKNLINFEFRRLFPKVTKVYENRSSETSYDVSIRQQ